MKRVLLFIISFTISGHLFAVSAEGVIQKRSSQTVNETSKRLLSVLQQKGFTIFIDINHTENAKSKGIEIPESRLVIFGNPVIGSKLMKCNPSIAIDLPQKALIWQQGENVWLTLNHPKYLSKRHNLSNCEKLVQKITKAIESIATETIR